jgi:hypothetical protein
MHCIRVTVFGQPGIAMTLRIDREGRRIRLCGELRSQQLDQVEAEIESCEMSVVLDLRELALVDVESVRFLNSCEENGISVVDCPPFIREWMSRERSKLSRGDN